MLAGRDQGARCQAETLRLCVVIAMMAIYALVRIGELEAPSSASLSFFCTQLISLRRFMADVARHVVRWDQMGC
jgi:hypothetical protein